MPAAEEHSVVERATERDLDSIRRIYNEGIADRLATLDSDAKSADDIQAWFADHEGRYAVLVAREAGHVAGWASLNRYSHRCAYDGVADLSIYVARKRRGEGIGTQLLTALEDTARQSGFHKIVLFALAGNHAGRALYLKLGYRDVGVFQEQGKLDGNFQDVLAMEKIIE